MRFFWILATILMFGVAMATPWTSRRRWEYSLLLLPLVTMVTTSGDSGQPMRFDGDSVIRVDVPDKRAWGQIQSVLYKYIPEQLVDVWREPDLTRTSDVYIPHYAFPDVSRDLASSNITFTTTIDDVQKLIDRESYFNKVRRRKREEDDHQGMLGRYARHYEILEWQEELVKRFPELIRTEDIGKTFEGRDMRVLKIGLPHPEGKRKWAIWTDSGMHAREWIAPATAIYFFYQLLDGWLKNDPEIRVYLEKLDWYFLFIANPDGYEYCHTHYRLWRLNRRPVSKFCWGVDLNRNWPYKWGGANAPDSPCSIMYRGQGPASEPETQNMAKFIWDHRNVLKAYVSLHSYTQQWFTRWAYNNNTLPDDHHDLMSVSQRAVDAIKGVYGKNYNAGNAGTLLYPFSGGSPDWARGVAGIKYPFLIELRDLGFYGFLLPEEEIIPTGREVWQGIKVLAREILSKYGQECPPRLPEYYGEGENRSPFPTTTTASPDTEFNMNVTLQPNPSTGHVGNNNNTEQGKQGQEGKGESDLIGERQSDKLSAGAELITVITAANTSITSSPHPYILVLLLLLTLYNKHAL